MTTTDQFNVEQEIFDLLDKEKRGEISYKDLYFELQKYPTDLKDRCLALYLCGGNQK